jgi:hypothetical protein
MRPSRRMAARSISLVAVLRDARNPSRRAPQVGHARLRMTRAPQDEVPSWPLPRRRSQAADILWQNVATLHCYKLTPRNKILRNKFSLQMMRDSCIKERPSEL